MRLKCPQCALVFTTAEPSTAVCPNCGFTTDPVLRARQRLADPGPYALPESPELEPQPMRPVRGPPTRGKKISGLVVNIVLPGAGTLLIGRRLEGWLQLSLLVVGLATIVFLIGLAIVPAVWLWAVASSVVAFLDKPDVTDSKASAKG